MNIRYTNRFSHLWLFHSLHQLRSPLVQGFVVLFAAFFAYSTATGSKCGGGHCVGLGVFAFVILYTVIMGIQLIFNGLYLYSRKNRTVLTEHLLEIRADGVYEETSYNKSLLLWPGIFKVVELPGLVAIYNTPHSALIIPVAAFGSNDARASFVSLLKERLSAV